MAKSLFLTYLCWLTGGLFGLHHFYLGRDDHAFITLATFGGYFTLGLIRDLWRLPEYVREANHDPEYLDKLHQQIKTHKKPPSSLVRQTGMMIVGNLLAFLVEYAIPNELLSETNVIILKFTFVPFASALGVWLAGNVGRHQGSLDKPLMASYLAASISHIFNLKQFGSFSTLAAFLIFNRYCRAWRIKPSKQKSLPLRMVIFILCIALYASLWSSWLYFNCTIEDPETGKPIKCRIALDNFMQSSAYTNLSQAVWMLMEHARHQGFSGLWREMMQEFDVSGRSTALATLGLSDHATPKEILAQYKKLSREYHPDRERDESKKRDKHEKFIQVQEAYRKLKSRDL